MKHAFTAILAVLLLDTPQALAGDAADATVSEAGDRARAALDAGEPAVEGGDGWRFLPAELLFLEKLTANERPPELNDAVEAIADFSDQMELRGIELIVMPVPPKALLHRDKLGDVTADASDDNALVALRALRVLYSELEERGVRVVDLTVPYAALETPAYCLRDSHWSGAGISAATAVLAEELAEVDLPRGGEFAVESREIEISGDLGGANETVELRAAAPEGERPGARNEPDRESPVLVLGDSHVLVFHDGGDMHAVGAGLPDTLAEELGFMPDVLGVRGSGSTASRVSLARRARADDSYLPEKKAIVWCFAARDFTEGDPWRKIPILPEE